MPINGLTETVRIPRLGKIHLGYKDPNKGFPVKTDYFVFPKDHSGYSALVKVFGEKPKELRILIPVEDEETWASQYYKAYDRTRGLICKGDGDKAVRMVDVKTGDLPSKTTETVAMKEVVCPGRECPDYKAKKCGEVMNLRFMLPEIPGLGVWQIDTGSINSILNINSCAKVIQKTFGRLTLVPLILSLESAQVNSPETGKKQTVYVMNLRTNVTLKQLADLARDQAKTLQICGPELEAEFDRQMEEEVGALFGEPKVVEVQKETVAPVEEKPPAEIRETITESKIDMPWLNESLKTINWKHQTVISFLVSSYKIPAGSKTLEEALAKLNKEQVEQFVKEVQTRLEMK